MLEQQTAELGVGRSLLNAPGPKSEEERCNRKVEKAPDKNKGAPCPIFNFPASFHSISLIKHSSIVFKTRPALALPEPKHYRSIPPSLDPVNCWFKAGVFSTSRTRGLLGLFFIHRQTNPPPSPVHSRKDNKANRIISGDIFQFRKSQTPCLPPRPPPPRPPSMSVYPCHLD